MLRRLAVSLARSQEVGCPLSSHRLPVHEHSDLDAVNPSITDRRATPRLQALLQEGFPGHPSAWSGLQQTRVSLQRASGAAMVASAARPALQGTRESCALPPRLPQAVHPAAAARLAEPPASSSNGGAAEQQQPVQQPVQQQPVQGATESVVFSSIARAAAEANKRPASGVPGVTKFLGFTGERGWGGVLLCFYLPLVAGCVLCPA